MTRPDGRRSRCLWVCVVDLPFSLNPLPASPAHSLAGLRPLLLSFSPLLSLFISVALRVPFNDRDDIQ